MVPFKTSRIRVALITWRDHPRNGFIVLPASALLDAGLVVGGGARIYDVLGIIRGPKILLEVVNWDGTDVQIPLGAWTWARGRGSFLVFISPRSVFYYASPSVSSGGDGSIGNPWSLRRALDGSGSPSPGAGDTLYLRGGTYYGGFIASIDGTAGNPVMIKPYPGEQYVIDQYAYGVLSSSITSGSTAIPITPASGISMADFHAGTASLIIDADNGISAVESVGIFEPVTGSSFTNIHRGHDGTPARAHSAGALCYASDNAFTITADYQRWYGCDPDVNPWLLSKIICSNPLRTFPVAFTADSSSWQRCKASFTASDVAGLELIGMTLHDSNDGIFITGVGGDHVVSALLAFNNGHVDSVRGNGQACYIHTETGAEFRDILTFSNFGSGSKFYGVNGTVNNCIARRVYSFNNAANSSFVGNPTTNPAMPSNKHVEGNWFMGSENDPMQDCAMYDSVTWMPYDSVNVFPHIKLGHDQTCNDFIIDNNWFIGSDQTVTITKQVGLTFTRNLVVQNTTGITAPSVQSTDNFFVTNVTAAALAAWTWGTGGNINSYYAKNYVISGDSFCYPFLGVKGGVTGTNEFASEGHQRYDVPSDSRDFLGWMGLTLDYHDQALPAGTSGFSFRTALSPDIPTRSHIACVKWDGTSMGTFTLPASALTAAGFVSGDSYRIYNAIDYFAGGANLLTGTFSGSGISIASGSFTRANPIGFTTENWRGNTWTMGFGVLIVYRIPSGGGGDTTPPTVSMTAPAPAATVSGTAVSVTANASDDVGVVGVQFKLDGSNLGTEDTAAPYAITWNTTLVADGSHTLTAVARDAAGNTTTSAGVTVTVANAVGDTTPPTVAITAPSPGATVSGTAVNLVADAADNVAVAGVQFKLNGSNINPEEVFAPYSTLWDSTTVANGTYTLTAVARDAAGNTTTAAPISITVDNVVAPPGATVILLGQVLT